MSTSDLAGTAFWLIPDNIKEIEQHTPLPASPTISVSKMKDDIKSASHLAGISKGHSADSCCQNA